MQEGSEKVGRYWFRNRTECQKSSGAALETSDDSSEASSPPPSAKAVLKTLFMNGEFYALAKFIPSKHFLPSKLLPNTDCHLM